MQYTYKRVGANWVNLNQMENWVPFLHYLILR